MTQATYLLFSQTPTLSWCYLQTKPCSAGAAMTGLSALHLLNSFFYTTPGYNHLHFSRSFCSDLYIFLYFIWYWHSWIYWGNQQPMTVFPLLKKSKPLTAFNFIVLLTPNSKPTHNIAGSEAREHMDAHTSYIQIFRIKSLPKYIKYVLPFYLDKYNLIRTW